MDEAIFLLDTCSYLRLAKSIRPLLNVPFNHSKQTIRLLVHRKLMQEIKNNSRLISKFSWITDKEFANDQNAVINLTAQEQNSITRQQTVVHEIASEESISTSSIDELCLTVAFVKNIYLVSDDKGIHELAKILDYEARVWTTLHILYSLNGTPNGPSTEEIQTIIDYWRHTNDVPPNFNSDLEKYFDTNVQ